MHHVAARRILDKLPLTGALIHKEMSRLFPKRSDYGNASFDELVAELQRFGVTSIGRFRALMKKHRRVLIEIDRDRLEPWEIKHFSESFGEAAVKDALRRQYWSHILHWYAPPQS